jgi:hypothetical protein
MDDQVRGAFIIRGTMEYATVCHCHTATDGESHDVELVTGREILWVYGCVILCEFVTQQHHFGICSFGDFHGGRLLSYGCNRMSEV